MNHYLPEEIAKREGMTRTEVIKLCHEMDVPIFQGRIDRTLFDEALREYRAGRSARQAEALPASRRGRPPGLPLRSPHAGGDQEVGRARDGRR